MSHLLPQFHQRCSLSTFILWRFGEGGYVWMTLQEFANAATEDARAMAMNDADPGQAGEEGAVKILLQLAGSLIDRTADEIDLRAHIVCRSAADCDVDVLLLPRSRQ